MAWLSFLKLLLDLACSIALMLEREQLMKAGEDRQIAKSLASLQQRLGIAKHVEEELSSLTDADVCKRMQDDEYFRDDSDGQLLLDLQDDLRKSK